MDNGILHGSREAMPRAGMLPGTPKVVQTAISRYMVCCTRYACDYVLGILCSQVALQPCSLVALMISECHGLW